MLVMSASCANRDANRDAADTPLMWPIQSEVAGLDFPFTLLSWIEANACSDNEVKLIWFAGPSAHLSADVSIESSRDDREMTNNCLVMTNDSKV